MNLVFATGIYPPDTGGPATYARHLKDALKARGHHVTVVTYGAKPQSKDEDIVVIPRKKHRALRYMQYLGELITLRKQTDATCVFDTLAAGLPVYLASKVHKKPYILRIGGGYLYERYLEGGNAPRTLNYFYKNGMHKKYWLKNYCIKKVIQGARMCIFNSEKQMTIYRDAYDLSPQKIRVIENAVLQRKNLQRKHPRRKNIVFAGRLAPVNNVQTLIRAFKSIEESAVLHIIGSGPERASLQEKARGSKHIRFHDAVPQEKLHEALRDAYLVVIPAYTTVAPNLAYECQALSVPYIITKENFLPVRDTLPNTFDPTDAHALADILRTLVTDSAAYALHKEAIQSMIRTQSFEEAGAAYETTLNHLVTQ